jgi:hypothetical protein
MPTTATCKSGIVVQTRPLPWLRAQFSIEGEGFQARIDPLIAASIQKLYGYQHEDGGWAGGLMIRVMIIRLHGYYTAWQ